MNASLSEQKQDNQLPNLWELLNHRPWKGTRTKKSIDEQIKKEREDWDKR